MIVPPLQLFVPPPHSVVCLFPHSDVCRLDPVILGLHQGATRGALSLDDSAAVIASREKLLLPVYQQVARAFADMHDTPGTPHSCSRGLPTLFILGSVIVFTYMATHESR